jgi:hypothetical protein
VGRGRTEAGDPDPLCSWEASSKPSVPAGQDCWQGRKKLPAGHPSGRQSGLSGRPRREREI